MPPKPNYKYQRAERDRARKASKESKLQEKKALALGRRDPEPATADPAAPLPGPEE